MAATPGLTAQQQRSIIAKNGLAMDVDDEGKHGNGVSLDGSDGTATSAPTTPAEVATGGAVAAQIGKPGSVANNGVNTVASLERGTNLHPGDHGDAFAQRARAQRASNGGAGAQLRGAEAADV